MIASPPSCAPAPACRFRIDPSRRVRIEEYQGAVGFREMRAAVESRAQDPLWKGNLHGFVDLSRARLELSANDALRLAMLLRREDCRLGGWIAFVVADSAAFGLVRMICHWTGTTGRARIFPSREEAEEWLARQSVQGPMEFAENLSDGGVTEVRIAG